MNPVDRVVSILEVFLNTKDGIGIEELSRSAGQNVSTTHRVVSRLVNRGYLRQDRKRGKYYLGPRFLAFHPAVRRTNEFMDISYPFLVNLNRTIGESVNLAIRDGYDAIYLEHVESTHSLRMFTQIGGTVPLHCTGVGKVILADMTEQEFVRFLEVKGLPRYTENTITNCEQLKNELAIIRREGVATDDQEMELGVRCIAAPVRDSDQRVSAVVSVSGPSIRIDINDRRMKFLVRDYALNISRALGYGGE